MDLAQIPPLLKHMTVALYFKKGLGGGYKAKFQRAFAIARASLVKNGYLYRGAEKDPPRSIRLTSKGVALNRKHAIEGRWKNQIFNSLYPLIQPKEEAKKDKPQTASSAVGDNRDERK